MNNFKINGADPDIIMSKGQQVDRIYSKATLVWEKEAPGPTFPEVTIGTQTWMSVNLDIDDELGGIYAYNNDEANVATYGRLYTWDAAVRVAASIDGWHLPSDAEWTTLTTYLGGLSVAGGKLKETGTTHWKSPNTGATNEAGFTALPGGYRLPNGTFGGIGSYGGWWSATELNTNNAWYRTMDYSASNVNRYNSLSKESGFSVRLIKDYSHTPNITLVGDNPVTISVGDTYTDAGATAYDTRYGDITSDIVVVNNVNTSVAGTYTVTYNITTEDGYSAEEVVRTVVVELALPQQNWEEVTIGNQTWMKYNLVIDDGQGGIYSYNNDIANAHVYGYLYTWDAAVRVAASIDGWHLPSDAEWNTLLITYLGGTTVAGGKLKEAGTAHWASPNAGATNESGFTALPGGWRNYKGAFKVIGKYGYWWSATEYDASAAWYRYVDYNYSGVYSYSNNKETGFSVRLIKDYPTYTLTVTNGTGDGTYVENTVVEIAADVPASGYQFKEWTGDIQYLASTTSSTTNVTMPAGGISVTATYELIPAETVTIGGEEYETVTIGTQTWLKRNLHFDDSVGGIYSYNNDIQISDVYGYLYTWDAAVRVAASIDGWHLPSDAEWTTLTTYLGGESVAGGKLKETGTTHWNSPNTSATNESGFTALPGGSRGFSGPSNGIGNYGYWWSATAYEATKALYRLMGYGYGNMNRMNYDKGLGHSVRLIKNTP